MKHRLKKLALLLTVLGPGIITAFADNDAAGVATYSLAASNFGYSIFFILLPITLVLFVTQEIGARLAIVTGKGFGDLIRERFGIRSSILIFFLLFLVNLAVVVQNLSGLKAAFQLFGLNYLIFIPITIAVLFSILVFGTYKLVERLFFTIILFYGVYFVSAFLAKPDWNTAFSSLVVPPTQPSFSYLYTAVAVLGTTVTAWGQFFINSSIKDKAVQVVHLRLTQVEVGIGAILTNAFSWLLMVAVAATIFKSGITITDAKDAALAIAPVAGALASTLFGMGLFAAGFLGCAIVPLATAYAFSEIFGYEGSLDSDFKKSRFFYSFFLIQILLASLFVMVPDVSLFDITLYANFINGLFLPVIFFLLYRLANSSEIMGKYKNNLWQNGLLIVTGILITIGGVAGALGQFFGW